MFARTCLCQSTCGGGGGWRELRQSVTAFIVYCWPRRLASLGWFTRWRILVILSEKCSRNRSAMTSSEQWWSGSVCDCLRPIRSFATLYMDFMFRVDSWILSQKCADFVVISSRLYVSRNEVNISLCTVSRVCLHRRSARRSFRFASDNPSLNQGVFCRMVMTRVMRGT